MISQQTAQTLSELGVKRITRTKAQMNRIEFLAGEGRISSDNERFAEQVVGFDVALEGMKASYFKGSSARFLRLNEEIEQRLNYMGACENPSLKLAMKAYARTVLQIQADQNYLATAGGLN